MSPFRLRVKYGYYHASFMINYCFFRIIEVLHVFLKQLVYLALEVKVCC